MQIQMASKFIYGNLNCHADRKIASGGILNNEILNTEKEMIQMNQCANDIFEISKLLLSKPIKKIMTLDDSDEMMKFGCHFEAMRSNNCSRNLNCEGKLIK